MSGVDKLSDKLNYQFRKINEVGLAGLKELKNLKVLNQVLLQQEAKRLERKLGKEHPRVKKLKSQSNDNLSIIRELEIEEEIAKIRVLEIPKGGALVHGRLVDKSNRGILGLVVYAENEKGNRIRPFGSAETDTSGYFAIQLSTDMLTKLQEVELYPTVSSKAEKVIHREQKPLELQPDNYVLLEIVLERENLRSVRKPGQKPPRKTTDESPGVKAREKKEVQPPSSGPEKPSEAEEEEKKRKKT